MQIEDEANIRGLERSVYVIRMAGSFIIQYPKGPSPVVYIGRGDSVSRLASHLKIWASEVFVWGSDTEIEIRILRPSRKNRTEYYKNVEADLLAWFSNRYGILPLINSRYETNWAGLVEYGPSQKARLRQMLGIGRGVRPKWAIQPLNSNKLYQKNSNKLYQKYLKGS